MAKLDVIRTDDTAMTVPEPGLRRQVMATSDPMMLVRHRMEAGWVGARHSHPHEQLIYIVSGEITLIAGEDSYDLRAGDSMMIPGGMEHQASATAASEVLDVFTPARDDYR
jgi:quercetin dioxygenase-like cupin family protein